MSEQMNQTVQSQETTNNEPAFDVNNLPPEFMRYVDQQRTQASMTARANAKKELMKDENFLNEIRNSLRNEIQKTADNNIQDIVSKLNKRVATSEVSRILAKGGIGDSEMSTYLDLFVSDDVDSSVSKAENFISVFNNTLQSRMEQQHIDGMRNIDTPHAQTQVLTPKEDLQAALDEARKETNPQIRNIKISAIMRAASEKDITLI